MPKVYGKVNGQAVARDVAAEQVASHVRRGWSLEAPKAKKAKKAEPVKEPAVEPVESAEEAE